MNTKSVTVTGCLALSLIFSHARAEDGFRACADLPPLLRFNDGAEVKTKADLERRKREVAMLLQRYFIGTFPEKAPGLVSAKVIRLRGPRLL